MEIADPQAVNYVATTVITGDTTAYLRDLTEHFRKRTSRFSGRVSKLRNKIRSGDSCWARDARTGRVQDISDNMPEMLVMSRMLLQMSRWQLRFSERILSGEHDLGSLDLINYLDHHTITHIFGSDDRLRGPSICIRDFVSEPLPPGISRERFVPQHLTNVDASILTESYVDTHLPSLEELTAGIDIPRSKSQVTKPVFHVSRNVSGAHYSTHLSNVQQEMLILLGADTKLRSCRSLEFCQFGGSSWSMWQAPKILRGLYGIIGITQKRSGSHHFYEDYWIDAETIDEAHRAVTEDGVFRQSISQTSLYVLDEILSLQRELRTRFGQDFYPRFHPKEIAERLDMTETEASGRMRELTGVLAPVHVPKAFRPVRKYFLSGARQGLAEMLCTRRSE